MINNNMIIQKPNNQNIMANDDTIKMKTNNNMMPNVLINKNQSINLNELNRDFKENSQNNNFLNKYNDKQKDKKAITKNLIIINNYYTNDKSLRLIKNTTINKERNKNNKTTSNSSLYPKRNSTC